MRPSCRSARRRPAPPPRASAARRGSWSRGLVRRRYSSLLGAGPCAAGEALLAAQVRVVSCPLGWLSECPGHTSTRWRGSLSRGHCAAAGQHPALAHAATARAVASGRPAAAQIGGATGRSVDSLGPWRPASASGRGWEHPREVPRDRAGRAARDTAVEEAASARVATL